MKFIATIDKDRLNTTQAHRFWLSAKFSKMKIFEKGFKTSLDIWRQALVTTICLAILGLREREKPLDLIMMNWIYYSPSLQKWMGYF